jgi:uncharacterized membrane protein
MNKREFLESLRIALTGKVSDAIVRENLAYYEEYIDNRLAAGSSEEEVFAELGDPRLIARTIVQTSPTAESGSQGTYENPYEQQEYDNRVPDRHWTAKIPGWIWLVIVILVVFALVRLAFRIVISLAPFLFVGAIIYLFVKNLKD